jgi:hypothetical protein
MYVPLRLNNHCGVVNVQLHATLPLAVLQQLNKLQQYVRPGSTARMLLKSSH